MSKDKMKLLYEERLELDKLIKDVRSIIRDVESYGKRLGAMAHFPTTGLLRGNLLGNIIRRRNHNIANKNLDRVQEAIIDLRTRLLFYDQGLADLLTLPSKLTGFSEVNSKLADLAFRGKIKMKELDVYKAKAGLDKLLRRLVARRRKNDYEIKKIKEFKDL